jgi:riboflavin kinase/FMN adenylyltransferase
MERVQGIPGLSAEHGRLFVVVGVFDGLHVGHAYLLRHLVAEARARGARPAVVTFDAHPDEVLTGSAPPLLLHPEERARLLAEAGVEVLIVVHFDDALRRTAYDDFVRSIGDRVELAGFLMTPDAAFGHERRGTPETLGELGRSMSPPFDVVVVPTFELDGQQVRSSGIRERIAAGDLAAAERLLGRPYGVVGPVDDGRLEPEMPFALPPDGTWRATVRAWPGPPDGRASIVRVAGPSIHLDGSEPEGPVEVAFPSPPA